ncbi:TetR/AcrR family transcriptional regulator [Alphaproteobacteria bacterium]|nr:TetR/AcrR family transcriptional regulator [Alphaproteobacteria bacterium]
MPYSSEHKEKTRAKIVEVARVLFNRHGFHEVTIDMIMAEAGLTRGGFYNHFPNKEALYSAAVSSFLNGRGAQWRREAGINEHNLDLTAVAQMVKSYLSADHLGDIEGQCPMVALPSDIARASPSVKQSFQELLEAMVWLLETGLKERDEASRQKALSLAALCVGGMTLARALPDSSLAEEVRSAAFQTATSMVVSRST